MHAIVREVEGLSAGKPVADRQYRYTCSQFAKLIYARLKKRNAGGNDTENGNNKTEQRIL